jgi:hypothetical protein
VARRQYSGARVVFMGVLAFVGLTAMVLSFSGASLPTWAKVLGGLAVLIVAVDGTVEGLAALAAAGRRSAPRS